MTLLDLGLEEPTRQIVVPPKGSKSAKIVIVGEAPGADEERKLEPFVGRSGVLLKKLVIFQQIILLKNHENASEILQKLSVGQRKVPWSHVRMHMQKCTEDVIHVDSICFNPGAAHNFHHLPQLLVDCTTQQGVELLQESDTMHKEQAWSHNGIYCSMLF